MSSVALAKSLMINRYILLFNEAFSYMVILAQNSKISCNVKIRLEAFSTTQVQFFFQIRQSRYVLSLFYQHAISSFISQGDDAHCTQKKIVTRSYYLPNAMSAKLGPYSSNTSTRYFLSPHACV